MLTPESQVGLIPAGTATRDGWVPDGSGHAVRLRHLSPEARSLLEAAAAFADHRSLPPHLHCMECDLRGGAMDGAVKAFAKSIGGNEG